MDKKTLTGPLGFLAGVALVAGAGAGMAFGVLDPITGSMLISNGLAILGLDSKLKDIAKSINPTEKEIKINVPKND